METKKSPKYYVMHPSSARHYSDLCHLKTFLPLLSFPSISEPGCQLTGEEPISQSSFFPFPPGKPAHLAALPPGAEAAGSPCQGVHHRSNPEAGAGTQTCPACIPPPQVKLSPREAVVLPTRQPPGGMGGQVHAAGGGQAPDWHHGVTEPCTSIVGCHQPLQWVSKVPAPPCCSPTLVQIKFFHSKKVKAVVF